MVYPGRERSNIDENCEHSLGRGHEIELIGRVAVGR